QLQWTLAPAPECPLRVVVRHSCSSCLLLGSAHTHFIGCPYTIFPLPAESRAVQSAGEAHITSQGLAGSDTTLLYVKVLSIVIHYTLRADTTSQRQAGHHSVQNGEVSTLTGKHMSVTDDLAVLLEVVPAHMRGMIAANPHCDALLEVVLDLGRLPQARFLDHMEELPTTQVSRQDIDYVVTRISMFGKDNRAGIERTLHRISAIRNRVGTIIGLTCRVGRALFGTVDILRDVIQQGRSLLLLGR